MSTPSEGTAASSDRFRTLPEDVPMVDTVAHVAETDARPEPVPHGPDGMDCDGD